MKTKKHWYEIEYTCKVRDKESGKRCGKVFKLFSPTQRHVCTKHLVELGKAKTNREMKRKFYADDLPTQKKLLETSINHIVRLIDKDHECFTCDRPSGQRQAGHRHSVGSNGSLRYHLFNIWTQCAQCNDHYSGRPSEYDEKLIKLYGKAFQEYVTLTLPVQYPEFHWKAFHLVEFVKRAREIEKELVKADKTYTNPERLEMRKLINERIGIYAQR